MNDFRHHVRRAVELKGSQVKLAEAMGCSQQHVSYLLNEATSISAESAMMVDRATDGQVSKSDLRPDVFPPQREVAA